MPPPVVIDTAKSVISPMPGSIISVSVEAGQKVTIGQEILIIEAMKMQNVIKAEKDVVISKVHVEAGANVGVDELLIEFE